MQEIKKLLEDSLNIDFLSATLSNPKDKNGITKVKVRPILKQGVLVFQCEAHKNNQVFHENHEAAETVNVLAEYMCQFKQMQMETKKFRYTVLVSKKGKVTIQKKQQAGCTKEGTETTMCWWKIWIRSRMGASARQYPRRQPVMA